MSINFKNAIVRLPSESIINAISSKGLSPNFLKAKKQHQAYTDTLKETGLDVKILKPLKYLPDSLFVEDPALIYNKICIILKPGVVTRLEEASKLHAPESIHPGIAIIHEPSSSVASGL